MAEKVTVKVVEASGSGAEPGDLSKYQGSTAAEQIKSAVEQEPVVIFGKTWCPFCLELRRTFDALGVKYVQFNIDTAANGGEIHAALKEQHKQTTVPYVFIGKEFIGGCDSTKALQAEGKLEGKLRAAGCTVTRSSVGGRNLADLCVLESRPRAPGTLFAFPEAVDERVARWSGFYSFVVCLLVAIYYERTQAHFVMLALMVDFILRFVGGANASPLGCLSVTSAALQELYGSKPHFIAGPPKQFAALCGVMFSALATLFFLLEEYEEKLNIVGLSFTCALGAAVGMEGFLGFCLGCFFFGLGIQFKLVPGDVYTVFTNVKPEMEYTWEENNKRLNEGEPPKHVKHLIDADHPLAIDYKYKAKTDDMTREDFHVIKHVKITHFLMPMGIAGLACAWKAASFTNGMSAPTAVYYAIALLAVTIHVVWQFLYFAKMFMYPGKVVKEWQCNLRGNSFVVPFINLVLFAYLVDAQSTTLAKVIYWMGAPATCAISLYRVGTWIAVRKDMEHVNAAWMIMPVSNFVSAFVGPSIDKNLVDWSQFLFGFAFVMWMLLFSLTFMRAVLKTDDDDRLRPLLAIWVAAPAVMAAAYLVCFLPGALTTPGVFQDDFIFINLMWFSVSLTLVLLVCFYLPFFGRTRFDMSYWAAGFPTSALAIVCILYNLMKSGDLSQGIAIAALAGASAINCMLALSTLSGIIRRKVFVPDYKWGPLSFMRLTHEAFRGAMPKILEAARVVANGDTSAAAIQSLQTQWRLMSMMHNEHARHEDMVIFKTYNEYFPGVAKPYNDDHEHHHDSLKKIDEAIDAVGKTGAASIVTTLEAYAEEVEKHLRGEEDHLVGMPRKWVPLAIHKDIMRKTWELSPAELWAEYIPWAVNNLPMLQQRVRFIKTFLWAMPERSQHIGIMLAMGVDAVQWKRITDELPELIPRGAAGWERYY